MTETLVHRDLCCFEQHLVAYEILVMKRFDSAAKLQMDNLTQTACCRCWMPPSHDYRHFQRAAEAVVLCAALMKHVCRSRKGTHPQTPTNRGKKKEETKNLISPLDLYYPT